MKAELTEYQNKFEQTYKEVEQLVFDNYYCNSLTEFISLLENLPEEIAPKPPEKNGDEFVITKEVEERLVDIARHHSYKINDEMGLLYTKLSSWYKKYGNYPSSQYLKKIIGYLRIDLLRQERKIRYIDGEAKVGTGVGKSFVSLDATLDDSKLSISDSISDVNQVHANEREVFSVSSILDSLNERERQVIDSYVFEEKSLQEIAEQFNLTESRICQIKVAAFSKLQRKYKEYAFFIKTKEKEVCPTISDYANILIKKPIRKVVRSIPKIKGEVTLKRYWNPSSSSLAREIYDLMLKDDSLELKNICEERRLSIRSLQQYMCREKLSLHAIYSKRKERLYPKIWEEWKSSGLLLHTFIKKNYNGKPASLSVSNWAKETGRGKEYEEISLEVCKKLGIQPKEYTRCST